MTSASEEKWRPFNCFFRRVGLRTSQHSCTILLNCTPTYEYGTLNTTNEVVWKYDQKAGELMGGTFQCRNPVILYRPSIWRCNQSYQSGVRYITGRLQPRWFHWAMGQIFFFPWAFRSTPNPLTPCRYFRSYLRPSNYCLQRDACAKPENHKTRSYSLECLEIQNSKTFSHWHFNSEKKKEKRVIL